MPKIVLTDQIIDGMITHSEVTNRYGQILIGSGALLTEKHKKMLKSWNVESVYIKNEDVEDTEAMISDDIITLAKERIASRILWEPRNKTEEDMIDLAYITTARRIKKQGGG